MNGRALIAFTHDVVVAVVTWYGAYWIRFNFEIPPAFLDGATRALVWLVPLYATVYYATGLYRGIWLYASLGDLRRLLISASIGGATMTGLVHMGQLIEIPRSVLLLHPILLLLVMGGDRFVYRAWKDGHLFGTAREGQSVLVIGAGSAGAGLLKELARSPQWRVVGLLDDDPGKYGRRIGDIPILGPIEDVIDHARKLAVTHAIIAMPSASAAQRRRAAELATSAGLAVLTVPVYDDILSGRVAVSQVRKVELEDLLGREQVQLDDAGLHLLLEGKTVLITGAGGSIGSELARQIARFSPKLLVFYELSEFALYRIEQEFAGSSIACVVGDVKDSARLDELFARYRPDVIFHAAAYKHVPMMENQNAWEAVRNNVLGTYRVAHAAMAHGASEFVLISTDKAVNPTNVMGATKRLAEMICQFMQRQAPATRFVTVRFGNVLGSSGSVIPKFREQIAAGGPVTVTHRDIIRYFMLIPEAAQLVLQAGLMGNGGEIFVLDMGEPVKIVDLARDLIRLSGFSEDDIRIEFTGLRPGEKLYEELLADGEATLPTPHPKLRIAKPQAVLDAEWLYALQSWLEQSVCVEEDVRRTLRTFVPEYHPTTA